MVENGIDEKKIEKMSEPVNLKTTGAGGQRAKANPVFIWSLVWVC